ncbi:hypothetical protein KSC_029580 [Ktedonobacter sp. SOSP1-52]|uniref:HEAT repeat domain-containing protein n=1 Tax=Ktedonobacter sp. SOSP1-52 TaxID=2778366 RepID=UPI0019162A77|nr:HEAT repeat domain-containing protein [Ktedonobacter sp. SOSP1-52]GHO64066.1 hypothetical protein KSC_029580 [Ktedonobacter sp. SOSP1-52]
MSYMDNGQDIADLIDALNNRTWKTRRQASDILIQRGSSAVLPLMAAIRQNAFTFFSLQEAVRTLAGIGDERAIDLLIELLTNWNVHAVQEAIKGLGRMRNPRAIQPLINVFRQDWDDPETYTAWQNATTALASIGEPAFEPLLLALKDEDSNVRQEVVDTLGKLRDPRALDPLVQALQDEQDAVRTFAADALATLGDKRAIEPLIALLSDEHWLVRVRALFALRKLGELSIFDYVVSALDDHDPKVREAAIFALGNLPDARVQDILLGTLKDSDSCVRCTSIRILGKVGDERALPTLRWIQQNDTNFDTKGNKMSVEAAHALKRIQERQQNR